jgi:hypothetical protein
LSPHHQSAQLLHFATTASSAPTVHRRTGSTSDLNHLST